MRGLVKTTLVIWSDPKIDKASNYEIQELADEAYHGHMYCSVRIDEHVENPEEDPMWDGTEFFEDDED